MDNVRTIWDKQYLIGSSSQLENSYLEGLKNLLTDVLEGLQSLQIENCHSLKEIFKVGEMVLPQAFPQLFTLAAHRSASVNEMWDSSLG